MPRDISPRVKFQCKLLQHLHSLNTQSHTSACMCTLKIPKDASHTTDRIHKNTAHTGRNGQHCARHKTIHPQPKTRHHPNHNSSSACLIHTMKHTIPQDSPSVKVSLKQHLGCEKTRTTKPVYSLLVCVTDREASMSKKGIERHLTDNDR